MQPSRQCAAHRVRRRRLFGRKYNKRNPGFFENFGDFPVAFAAVGPQMAAVVELDDGKRSKPFVGNHEIHHSEQFVAVRGVIELFDQ